MPLVSRSRLLLTVCYLSLACALVLPLSECEHKKETTSAKDPAVANQLDALGRKVDELVGQAKQSVNGLSPLGKELAEEMKGKAFKEFEALYQFEYRVVSLGDGPTPTQLEAKLQELGKDRWDCFHIQAELSSLTVFCKRRPATALQYLQLMSPLL